jgi:hypothetical protein
VDVESIYSTSRWILNWFIDANAIVVWMLNFDLKTLCPLNNNKERLLRKLMQQMYNP